MPSPTPFVQATPKMEVSAVVDSRTGQSRKSSVRTSTGAFFGRGYDEVVRRIEKRIAQVTMIPIGEEGGVGKGVGRGVLGEGQVAAMSWCSVVHCLLSSPVDV